MGTVNSLCTTLTSSGSFMYLPVKFEYRGRHGGRKEQGLSVEGDFLEDLSPRPP